MPPLSSGFYFSRYSKTIQCTVCHTPWENPVELKPCGHVFCRECIANPEECPFCLASVKSAQKPTQALIDLINEVFVMCEHCDWAGSRQQAKMHMCRGRQRHLCSIALRANAEDRNAWFGLAVAIKAGETLDFDGQVLTKVGCYQKCVELGLDDPLAWTNLGAALPPAGTVTIGGVEVTKKGCYIRALEIDPKSVAAWFNLGNSLETGAVVQILGNPVFKDTCYIRAVEADPKFAPGWYNLGLTIDAGYVIDYKGVEMGKKECFREAVIARDSFAVAWNSLGMTIRPGKEVKMPNGTRVSKKQCFQKAVTIDPSLHEAWYNLSECLKPDEYAMVDGLQYTKNECMRKSGQRDRDRTEQGSTETPRSNSSGRSSTHSRSKERPTKGGCITS
jgi:hypothetical protein